MRSIHLSAAILFGIVVMAPSIAGTAESSSTSTATQSKKAACDAERKACYAGKTQTGSFGSTYVAPEDVQTCEAGYRMCVNGGH